MQSDGTADDALLAMITALAPLGVILLSDHQSESLAGALICRGIPSVLCGGLPLGRKISAVHIDNMQAAYDGDPAAYSMDEIILCYPGLYAIMVSRIAHELFLLGVPLIRAL